MNRKNFLKILKEETKRIDKAGSAKREEKLIEGFTLENPPRAIIKKKKYYLFNSNDYLSLRYNPKLKKAEREAGEKYGSGPGAVRFISGTLKIHKNLERVLAKFHRQEDAIIYSSTFAANLGVIFPLIQGQSKISLLNDNILVISDELNHRSIIDAIRLAKLKPEQKAIFKHLNINSLEEMIQKAVGKFERILILTDGVFSMLGEIQKIDQINNLKKKYDSKFKNGIFLLVDDAHGVGALGKTGRGVEEVLKTKADVLIATLGKAFGADGGYAVSNQIITDYLRESSATYIYSNPISPGTAAAALMALKILNSSQGGKILTKLANNIRYFKEKAALKKIPLAADSFHPVQPVLVGETVRAKQIVQQLFARGFLTTAISYPVVPPNRDEIRIQINACHTFHSLDLLLDALSKSLNQKE